MTKPVIDDAMVKRACRAAFLESQKQNDVENLFPTMSEMRAALEAALTEPPAETIAVSEMMYQAAEKVSEQAFRLSSSDIAAIYRAMESQRRKEAAPENAGQPNEWVRTHHIHSRIDDSPMTHRRHTDPAALK